MENTEKTPMVGGVIGLTVEGLSWATVLAQAGVSTMCTDMDEEMVNGALEGELPGEEPGLSEAVATLTAQETLVFSSHPRRLILNCPVIFVSAMVPMGEDHQPSLRFVEAIARQVANTATEDRVLVIKSVVPPGSCSAIQRMVDAILAEADQAITIQVVSMPDLYARGNWLEAMGRTAVMPVGCLGEIPEALSIMLHTLSGAKKRIAHCTPEEAELSAYAYSGLLAIKQTYGDGITRLSQMGGSDSRKIKSIVRMQEKTGYNPFSEALGYGGSCISQEIETLRYLAGEKKAPMGLLESVSGDHKRVLRTTISRIKKQLRRSKAKKIAVLGMAPIANTDDLRDAPALVVIQALVAAGYQLQLFTPHGLDQVKWRLFRTREDLFFCLSVKEATQDVDAVVILGRWKGMERLLMPSLGKRMAGTTFIDVVHAFDQDRAAHCGLDYYN